METTGVAIIGAGPIGLETAAGLKRAGVRYVQFDAGQVGATMGWWAPGTRFFSSPERIAIAGIPLALPHQEKASREEYLAYLRGVVQQVGLEVRRFERVTSIEPRGEGKGFLLRTKGSGSDGVEGLYGAEKVVAAIGDMHRPRRMGIAGEDLPHVSHYFHEPHAYFGRRVVIVGGRNSAVEAAIRCWRVGAKVTISHRRAEVDPERIKYWLLPEIKHLIKSGEIVHHPLTVVRGISPTAVMLAPASGGEPFEVEADAVLLLTGYEMDGFLLEAAGVELIGEQRSPRHDPGTMETNVPGLYVAGTAAAGTQMRFRLFIENCHIHAERIVAAVTGRKAQGMEPNYTMPES